LKCVLFFASNVGHDILHYLRTKKKTLQQNSPSWATMYFLFYLPKKRRVRVRRQRPPSPTPSHPPIKIATHPPSHSHPSTSIFTLTHTHPPTPTPTPTPILMTAVRATIVVGGKTKLTVLSSMLYSIKLIYSSS
jgi:hypothetical protein